MLEYRVSPDGTRPLRDDYDPERDIACILEETLDNALMLLRKSWRREQWEAYWPIVVAVKTAQTGER